MTEQVTFVGDPGVFVDNPEPRCACLLLLDVSGSMQGAPIAALNQGLAVFKDELASDDLAMKRVEVGIVTFGPVKIESPFVGAVTFYPPSLSAQGDTPMGAAIKQGFSLVRQRKDEYRAAGVSYYKPWIFLITDGAPTDEWQSAAAQVREEEANGAAAFFAIGVQGANMDILKQIAVRQPLSLDGLKFRELFQWLSNSMKTVSRSTPGTGVPLSAPSGWAAV